MKYANYVKYVPRPNRLLEIRPAHREYIDTLIEQGKVLLAGPFADDSGALFVYEAASLAEAREIARNDPYNLKGVFDTFEVIEWDIKGAHPNILNIA
jgi:uncharacterized protein YciI